ncbi:MAG: hypothetical protein OEU92_34435 [Alphaproteobacteria bacterium]|nr:hypothetical protein [Alphaproteobacteria bacterium]
MKPTRSHLPAVPRQLGMPLTPPKLNELGPRQRDSALVALAKLLREAAGAVEGEHNNEHA